MGGFGIAMVGLLTLENSARQEIEPSGECALLESLYQVPAGKTWRNKVRLRKSVLSRAGTPMHVNVVIQLIKGRSLKSQELEKTLRECCSEYFEYAISTSHAKTVLCGLDSPKESPVGDLTATFLPAL